MRQGPGDQGATGTLQRDKEKKGSTGRGGGCFWPQSLQELADPLLLGPPLLMAESSLAGGSREESRGHICR